ncbi:chemotaxis protein CheD [Shewanella zhangzhouensis]|uniref:chemotaxis protein CheD n=1 Tax=Shewanella zhangzhouensis TaxID=2864213 RepID=UPI001C65A89A|nr:chemotaxis protein CheD [Shewanella zhangzhouensis]QYK03554.1 chemotaxis protein CheD [Shewanella zhangzhouensis]
MRFIEKRPSSTLRTLKPAELFYGNGDIIVHTLLGSCVAITIWHPGYKVGGMCHYLLPVRQHYSNSNNHPPGHYGTDAIEYFLEKVKLKGLRPQSFEVKIFGGGNILHGVEQLEHAQNVAHVNVEQGRILLKRAGFNIKIEDVGGVRYRNVYFELISGDVWVQYGKHTKS